MWWLSVNLPPSTQPWGQRYYFPLGLQSDGFPDSSVGKESACNAEDPSSIPGSRRSSGEGIDSTPVFLGFPCSSAGKESACNVGDLGLIPGLERSPGEGKGYPLQCSGLENSMDYSPWGCKESDTTERLSLSLLQSELGMGIWGLPHGLCSALFFEPINLFIEQPLLFLSFSILSSSISQLLLLSFIFLKRKIPSRYLDKEELVCVTMVGTSLSQRPRGHLGQLGIIFLPGSVPGSVPQYSPLLPGDLKDLKNICALLLPGGFESFS